MSLKKVSIYFKYAPAGLPLYSLQMVSISIILMILGALLHCDYSKLKKRNLKDILVLIFPFIVFFIFYTISLIWTQDTNLGLRYIEKVLSFLIFPVVIFVLEPFKNDHEIGVFIRTFIISTFVFCIVTLYSIFFTGSLQEFPIRDRIEQVFLIGEHPIYFSLLLAISVVLLVFYPIKNRIISMLFILVFISGILTSGTRGIFIALLIAAVIMICLMIKNRAKIITILVSLFLSVIVAIMISPLKERMAEFVNTTNFYPQGIHYNSFNIRMAIYKCSFNILTEELIIGHGPGDVQNELNNCYQIFPTKAFTYFDYNTHNQYLHYLCAFGIVGTIILLYFFFYYLKIAWVNKNWSYFIFLLLLYLSFFTENILVRNTGIVVFTMFNCILAYQTRLDREPLKN